MLDNNYSINQSNNQSVANAFDFVEGQALVGQSEAFQEIVKTIEKIAPTDSTVLITGESGTGKEVIAKAIHARSNRGNQPLVIVNCGAIPSELLEAELFGHVKGAFTGATQNRIGRFEAANGGTLFLDEVGDLPLALQVKILRAIQTKQFESVGSSKTVEVDVRFIAATNKDLELAVKNREFREDLYYRLNVIPIRVPSLKERKGDIPRLAEYFLKVFNQSTGNNVLPFSAQILDAICVYSWPGNIRELENLVERLVILKGQGMVELADLPHRIFQNYQENRGTAVNASIEIEFPKMTLPTKGLDLKEVVAAFENHLIDQALARTNNNKNRASELLMMNRTTLVEKLRKRGMITPAPKRNTVGYAQKDDSYL